MSETILVTGGSGFIGSHTCLVLLEKGYKVLALDSNCNSKSLALKKVAEICNMQNINIENKLIFKKGDLRNKSDIQNIFEEANNLKTNIVGVIHFGGLKSVSESLYDPINYWDTNVLGSINLLNVMNQYKCEVLVFSSSACIYSSKDNFLIKEKSDINPLNPYGSTKMVVEKFLHNVFNSNTERWKIANLRYFNPIGAHKSGLIGESPVSNNNNLFPLINDVAYYRQKTLKVFGDNWPTIDGTPVRDYVHIMDLAESHVKILEYLNKNNPQITDLNIGTGKGTSVLELIKTFEQTNNVKVPYEIFPRRDGDLPFLVSDNSLASSILDWSPKFDLKDMCRDGWKWKQLNPNGY